MKEKMNNFKFPIFNFSLAVIWFIIMVLNFFHKDLFLFSIDLFNFLIWSLLFIQNYKKYSLYKSINNEQIKKRKEQEIFNQKFHKIKNIYYEKEF